MINIYRYTDYRTLLKDFCENQRNENAKFSQRYCSQKLGSKSPSFYKDLIQGKKNLSQNNIFCAIKLMRLNSEQEMFFENLVLFNQAKTIENRDRYFRRVVSCKKVSMETLNKDSYEFFSKWYHSAIRELLYYYPFSGNYRNLAKQLIPAITEVEAKESIKLLEKMGYIENGPDNIYTLNSSTLTTGSEIQHALEIAKFQTEMINLSKSALNLFPLKRRDISSLTLSLSQNAFTKIKTSIQAFRKDILTIASEDSNEDAVYQCNFQFFPITKTYSTINKRDNHDS